MDSRESSAPSTVARRVLEVEEAAEALEQETAMVHAAIAAVPSEGQTDELSAPELHDGPVDEFVRELLEANWRAWVS